VAEWICFLHAPRDDFAATMSDHEREVFAEHFARLQGLLADGVAVLVGPTLGRVNTGIMVFEAPDEQTAWQIVREDPTVVAGITTPELRGFRLSLLRGRDVPAVKPPVIPGPSNRDAR
jgi:uncharacterized protein YciI